MTFHLSNPFEYQTAGRIVEAGVGIGAGARGYLRNFDDKAHGAAKSKQSEHFAQTRKGTPRPSSSPAARGRKEEGEHFVVNRQKKIGRNKMPGNTEVIARFVSDLKYEDIPREVVERAKRQILDVIGVALAGSTQE